MFFFLGLLKTIIGLRCTNKIISTQVILYLISIPSFCNQPQNSNDNIYRIGSITILRNEIFSENDSININWITETTNWVHSLTNEKTISTRLLFQEGDVYNQSIIDETGRMLRAMGILGEISIIPDTISNNIINITIITNDKWTLGINTTFKRDGGITTYNIKLKEENFLGNAQSISFDHNYSSDRSKPYGIEAIFREPHLLSTWWNMILQYKSNEYLDVKTFLLERPLFSDTITWSLGMYCDSGRNRLRIFKEGAKTQEFDLKQENQSIWYTLRPNIFNKASVGFNYIRKRTETDSKYLKPVDNLDLANLSFNVVNRTYYTTTYIENFGRTEDISLGYRYSINFGKNFKMNNSSKADYYYQVSWQQALHTPFNWYLSYGIDISSYLINGRHTDAVLNCNLTQYLKISERNLLVLRSITMLGYNWSDGSQVILGSQTGLRGYPAYAFSGNRKLLFNIEHRFFSDLKFLIFRLGSVLFFDSGLVWNENDTFANQRFHSSAGFGLRIENIKQSGSGILRIDFAYNFDQNRFVQVIFSSNHLFSVIQQIQNSSSILGF